MEKCQCILVGFLILCVVGMLVFFASVRTMRDIKFIEAGYEQNVIDVDDCTFRVWQKVK